ncbi:hypothetical protein vseg_014169 [Gypsophila vaccaria]
MATEQVSQQMKQVIATMANMTKTEIYCERYFNWSGRPGPFPPTMNAGGVVEFDGFGSKGAVLYNGPMNPTGRYQPAWVLAWDAPGISTGGAPNKVYVFCGGKSEVDNLTEKQILERLEASSDESKAEDSYTKTFITAILKSVAPVDPVVGVITVTFGSTDV